MENGFQNQPDGDKDRNFVTALARGLELLRCFRHGESELGNTDFAERTGLPKPTISRLTYTLCKLDYLVADPRSGTYRLGAGVLQLGFGVLSGLEIGERAIAQLRKLRNGPNSYITSALGEPHRDEVIYLAVKRSRESVALSMHVGSRLPLFGSAIGRAILAGMDSEARITLLDALSAADPKGDKTRRETCDEARFELETLGYCTGFGKWRSDVNGIAVPVTCLDGGRIYGLNVGGPAFHVKRKQLESWYAPRLIEAGKSLSLAH